ncbi:MAG: hypothetical protein LBK62_11700 [Treponema sp.]|jgi:prophage antirepressor-like protein|nr:hypothetical protein [Treponema sp.]
MNELQVRDGVSKRHPISQVIPFNFENHAVRTVVIDQVPWWVGKDVCEVLEISNYRQALETTRTDKNGMTYINFPETEKSVYSIDTLGGKQKTLLVNEPGLYRLIFQSRKPQAERFKTWVFNEALPQIRKTEKYSAVETRLETLEEKVDRLFEEKETRDKLDRCERSKKRATPKDYEEIRELHKAGYTKKAISRITYWGLTVINNALREDANQPSLFDDGGGE